jgi:hypothetical protein
VFKGVIEQDPTLRPLPPSPSPKSVHTSPMLNGFSHNVVTPTAAAADGSSHSRATSDAAAAVSRSTSDCSVHVHTPPSKGDTSDSPKGGPLTPNNSGITASGAMTPGAALRRGSKVCMRCVLYTECTLKVIVICIAARHTLCLLTNSCIHTCLT